MRASYYISPLFDHKMVEDLTALACEVIKDLKADAVAFRGLSGALIAPNIARRLGIGMIAVRKGEHSHADYQVEGHVESKRVVIVDDLVSSGATVRSIRDAIQDCLPAGVENPVIAVVLYKDYCSGDLRFDDKTLPVYAFAIEDGVLHFNHRLSQGVTI